MADLFNIGLSGLRAAQTNLSVTGQNITNVNTPGYSRQTALQSANPPGYTGATDSLACQCLTGKGESVHEITEESEELHEERVYSKLDIAETCACGDKEEMDNYHAQRTKKYISVYAEKRCKTVTPPKSIPDLTAPQPAVIKPAKNDCQH